jgi:hypothetical protein
VSAALFVANRDYSVSPLMGCALVEALVQQSASEAICSQREREGASDAGLGAQIRVRTRVCVRRRGLV